MKVLVTGAGGFVGQALCTELTQRGYDMRGAVRMLNSASTPPVGTTIAVGDIGPTTNWSSAVEGVDAVVHLAARVHRLDDNATDATDAYRHDNVEATRSLAEAARRAGVDKLIFLSTAKVHGERSMRPFRETDTPRPEDAYAASKLEAERAIKDVLGGSHTHWTILRPPLVYGPGVRANFLRLLQAVARGVPLPVGGIENRRSLLYLSNLVDAIERCLNVPGTEGKTWLLNDGEDLSTPELIRRLARALNRSARLVSVPVWLLRSAATLAGKTPALERMVSSLQVDASAVRAALDWTPRFSVDQGLAETARWFRSRHGL